MTSWWERDRGWANMLCVMSLPLFLTSGMPIFRRSERTVWMLTWRREARSSSEMKGLRSISVRICACRSEEFPLSDMIAPGQIY